MVSRIILELTFVLILHSVQVGVQSKLVYIRRMCLCYNCCTLE